MLPTTSQAAGRQPSETVEHFNFFACDALNTDGFRRDGIPYARQLLDSLSETQYRGGLQE